MPGLGRKTFAPGEVLRAADVNGYLMDQSVMSFAGTAARGSAIGTAVSEGMVSYLADSNSVEAYNGSSWFDITAGLVSRVPSSVATGGGSYTTTNSGRVSFTGVSSVSLNGVFTSEFNTYKIVVSRLASSSAGITQLYLNMRAGGTNNTGANYNYEFWRLYGAGTPANGGATGQTGQIISFMSTGAEHGFSMDMLNPQGAQSTQNIGQGFFYQSDIATTIAVNFAGYEATTNQYDGFTLTPGAGTITGQIRVLGYRDVR